MPKVNVDKITTLLGEAKLSLARLQHYALMDGTEILSSDERLSSVKYQFIICDEACLNLCQHISSKDFSTVPDTYAECFKILATNNILQPAHAKRLSEFAAFRNLLVHLYWKVDNSRVIEMLKNLSTIDEYLDIIWDRYGLREPNEKHGS